MADEDKQALTLDRYPLFNGKKLMYFRCTLVATESLNLRAYELTKTGRIIRPKVGQAEFGGSIFNYPWGLRLNGVENLDWNSRHFAKWFIGDHGIVDVYGFVALGAICELDNVFSPANFSPIPMQVIALGEVLRRESNRPEIELVIESEFLIRDEARAIPGDGSVFDEGVHIPKGSIRSGPFSLGGIDDYRTIYSEMERNIWHGLGMPVTSPVTFEMSRWLTEMGRPQCVPSASPHSAACRLGAGARHVSMSRAHSSRTLARLPIFTCP